jgi:hypothetical protein
VPACAATGVLLALGDFDDNDAQKKPFGKYAWVGIADTLKFDPDLDVSPPSGIVKNPRRRR